MSALRRTALVVAVAVLGIALAAAITWGTSQLVRQRIGLASEPLTAGRRLLPAASAPASRPSITTAPTTSTSRRAPSPAKSRTTSTSIGASTTTAAPVQPFEPRTAGESAKPVTARPGAEADASSHRDD